MSFNMKFSFEFIKIKYNMEHTLFPSNPGVCFGFEVLVALGSLALLLMTMICIGVIICKIKKHSFDEEECLSVIIGLLVIVILMFGGATTLLVQYN